MIIGRYDTDSKIDLGSQYAVAKKVRAVRRAIRTGEIKIESNIILTGEDRLDTLAATIYGDARLWWLLATASNIGWGMQVPPGTIINIIDISKVNEVSL